MTAPDLSAPGAWRKLFPSALRLMAHLETQIEHPVWSFGGGTVLMLRLGHRQSKDIDLFVPDPQYLGFVNPRLSDAAESITTDYDENAEFIKLYLPAGEIDIVVGHWLTQSPFELIRYRRMDIRLETCAEIIAKKMWHRGDRAKARDLFDLCAVAQAEPAAIAEAAPFLKRHGARFLALLEQRTAVLQADFEAIDSLGFKESFPSCVQRANALIQPLLTQR